MKPDLYPQLLMRHLLAEENCFSEVYRDTLGHLTVGFGHLIADDEGLELGNEIPTARIFQHLVYDIAEAEAGFTHLFSHVAGSMSVARRVALVSMVFQMGDGEKGGVGGFRKMRNAIDRGDWPEAGAEALDSKWATQTHNRAIRISQALKTGTPHTLIGSELNAFTYDVTLAVWQFSWSEE